MNKQHENAFVKTQNSPLKPPSKIEDIGTFLTQDITCDGRSMKVRDRFRELLDSVRLTSFGHEHTLSPLEFDRLLDRKNPAFFYNLQAMFNIDPFANLFGKNKSRPPQYSDFEFEKVREIQNKNWASDASQYGFELMMKSEFDRAIYHFKSALELDRHSTRAMTGLAAAYVEKSELSKAKELLEKCLNLDMRNDEAFKLLESVLWRTRQLDIYRRGEFYRRLLKARRNSRYDSLNSPKKYQESFSGNRGEILSSSRRYIHNDDDEGRRDPRSDSSSRSRHLHKRSRSRDRHHHHHLHKRSRSRDHHRHHHRHGRRRRRRSRSRSKDTHRDV